MKHAAGGEVTGPAGPPAASRPRRRRFGRRPWVSSVIVGLVIGAVMVGVVWAWSDRRQSSSNAKSILSDQLAAFFGPSLDARSAGSFGLDRMQIRRSAGTPFGYFARVTYPALSSSNLASQTSDGITVGGSQVYLQNTAGPGDRAFLRYYLRLPAGFQWVKGGKLPGLYGGTVTSGRKIPDGDNGLSTRYMWRAGGAGEVYAYLPTSKDHGTSLGRGDWQWPTGRWTCVEQEVALNDPGQSNGRVNVWLADKQVLARSGLTFRDSAALKIDGLFFSTFFGGGDATWATPVQQQADFADFRISSSRIGC